MKILLIYPYFLEDRLHVEEIAAVPMGLYYVGAMLKDHGHQVELLNWHDKSIDPQTIKETLVARQPQVIGFSITHANRWGAIDIARLAKELDPKINIVLGGIGATFLWHHLLSHFEHIDYVVVGEGEYAFLDLVNAIETDDDAHDLAAIPGLALRVEDDPVQPTPPQPIEDLDRLPPPARYFDFQHLALTRGCPSRCTFCGSPQFWGRRVRAHSADYFVDQLQMLTERGTTFFYVSDDTFTLNTQRVINVCRQIIQRGLKIVWQAISKVNAINDEMLFWMRKAGCVQISYGVESGSPAIRERLCKDINDDQIEHAFHRTAAHGILPRAYFIYGAPGESPQTVDETLALIDRIKPLSAIFYILDIFPGTSLYAAYKQSTGATDDIWLERKEDILYFETDAELDAEAVTGFGRRLREGYHQRLMAYATTIELKDQPDLVPEQADFLSRLGLTFSHGDYSQLEGQPAPIQVAETLFQRALEMHPDHRAFWGLTLVYQQQGKWDQAREVVEKGLESFPNSPDLNVCMASLLLKNGGVDAALEHLLPFEDHPQARSMIIHCYQAKGDHQRAARYSVSFQK
jgi:radical SAM superfamily enzyme YgiQ (UPF0313 family)